MPTLIQKNLILNEDDSLWGLTVNTIGSQTIEPFENTLPGSVQQNYYLKPDKAQVPEEYQLLYITQGSGIFQSQGIERITLTEGMMVLLFPGEWHSYKPDRKTGWQEYWIGFNGENIDRLINNNFFNRENPVFHIGKRDDIIDLFKKAIDLTVVPRCGYQQILAGICNYILGLTFSYNKSTLFKPEIINRIDKSREIMHRTIYDRISPEEIAEELQMSYSWFRKSFRDYVGMSPNQYMLELKLQVSKELLITTSENVKNIALKLGYENPEYFSFQFKKRTNQTPMEFRTKMREE